MGYAAVALLAATGAINTLLLVGNVDSLAGTPHGRLLSLKILLFSVTVVLALINRFRCDRRPAAAPQREGFYGRRTVPLPHHIVHPSPLTGTPGA
jgi:putative copper export protein